MAKNGPSSIFNIFLKNKEVDEEKVEEEILYMIEEGQVQGAILSDEAEMICNIFQFGDKETKDVMTARQKVVGIDVDTSLEEAMQIMLKNGFSRYPLYEGDIDSIIGVLYLKEAMVYYMKDKDINLRTIAKETLFVHPTQNISKLFKEMQAEKLHMAVVIDEYGQTEGIVAMEDILEVIVGNIFDEHDKEENDVVELDKENNYLIKGMARLDVVSEILGIDFSDEDIDTLNGFILYQIGRLPVESEEIEVIYEGYSFKPIDIHDKMVVQVMVSKIISNDDESEQG